MAKRLVVCCDGTWNRRDQANPTNVVKVHDALAAEDSHETRQVRRHVEGVGTTWGERIRGGVFGMGLSRGVVEAYEWIATNYEPGNELFLFGFSRGAFTARSTAGLVRNCGIVTQPTGARIQQAYTIYRSNEPPDGPRVDAFRAVHAHWPVPIRFIGVWDTVGSLGIPVFNNPVTRWINRRWAFHDTALSSSVDGAYHALAIDKVRKPYSPTLWKAPKNAPATQRVEQVWFTGAHSDVGGGFAQTGLSDLALLWMIERAEYSSLVFTQNALKTGAATADLGTPPSIRPDPWAIHNKPTGLFRLVPTAPRTRSGRQNAATVADLRTQHDATYQPANLLDAIAGEPGRRPCPAARPPTRP